MVDVADLADGGHAVRRNVAQLAGRQTDQRISAFFRHQLSLMPAARQLSTFSGYSSTLWMKVPTGMLANGSALPAMMSRSGLETRYRRLSGRWGR